MLLPICDDTRLMLGIIATLGGIFFASMSSILKADIKLLFKRILRKNQPKDSISRHPHSSTKKTTALFNWLLLIVSFLATIGLGPYVAAVPSKTCVKIIIAELVCDPEGDELSGEYVRLQNLSSKNINLNKWTLCDYQSRHCYMFKNITFQAHSDLTIWTKAGNENLTDLYFDESQPIWTNAEDTAYLYDVKGQLIYQRPCP